MLGDHVNKQICLKIIIKIDYWLNTHIQNKYINYTEYTIINK